MIGFLRSLFKPKVATVPYRGVKHSLGTMVDAVQGPRGATSPLIRLVAEQVVLRIHPKDYLSQVLALRYWCNTHLHYTRDPVNVEWIRDPQALIEEMVANAEAAGAPRAFTDRQKAALVARDPRAICLCDCDEFSVLLAALCLQVGAPADFVTVGFGQKPIPHSHVFVRVAPKGNRIHVVVDPVAGSKEAWMLSNVGDFEVKELG